MSDLFAEISVFAAFDKTLHYLVPEGLHQNARIGCRVIAPLGRSESLGLIVALERELTGLPPKISLRPLFEVVDQAPIVPADLLELCRWISSYYFYPLGQVLKAALPAAVTRKPSIRFRCTRQGRKALTEEPKGSSFQLLALLCKKSEASIQELLSAIPAGEDVCSGLNELQRLGLIERRLTWKQGSEAARRIQIVQLISRPEENRIKKSKNLQALISILERAGGSLPLNALRRSVSNLSYWINKLRDEGFISIDTEEKIRESDFAQSQYFSEDVDLTSQQIEVIDKVSPFLQTPTFKPFLLSGVTGSGKTEVYLRLIEMVNDRNKGALVLVPEIALSTQLEAVFRHRFGSRLAVCHSGLGAGARFDQWREALAGNRKVVLGVRSAVFMPVKDLALIIVDEEHDPSYKQEDRLRYHARDVALMRAKMLGIPIILGSATPSLQSYHHAAANRYQLLSLPRRVLDRPLPDLEVVDMRRAKGRSLILSGTLREALLETYKNQEQSLIFLNRRGFATFLLCHICGHVVQCSHCSVSLTYHQKLKKLCCHYCGWERALPEQCEMCGRSSLILHGFGTERVEEEIKGLLPEATLVRMDRDTVSHPKRLLEILNAIRERRADVLIGTQMIAKGHDFPHITLVGVISADTALQVADFRAGETTVQLLMQVAGRSGRGKRPGRVILQTFNPTHYTIESVLRMEYDRFCEQELKSRKELQYPPFTRLVRFLVMDHREAMAKHAAATLAALGREVAAEFRSANRHVVVLGPSPAPIYRLNRRYRWQLFAKAWTNRDMMGFIEAVMALSKTAQEVQRIHLAIDRDPMTTL